MPSALPLRTRHSERWPIERIVTMSWTFVKGKLPSQLGLVVSRVAPRMAWGNCLLRSLSRKPSHQIAAMRRKVSISFDTFLSHSLLETRFHREGLFDIVALAMFALYIFSGGLPNSAAIPSFGGDDTWRVMLDVVANLTAKSPAEFH